MPSKSPPWHAKARELFAAGKTMRVIAVELGVKYAAVYDLLRRRCERNRSTAVSLSEIEPHKPRAIPVKIDPMPICRMFAAGEIDRATMSKMLTGEIAG